LEASQQFSFYRVGLLAPRPTPIPEDQASVFIFPRGRVATHFSSFLRHAWVTVGLFLFPGHEVSSVIFFSFTQEWKRIGTGKNTVNMQIRMKGEVVKLESENRNGAEEL
jgi:hypothetical protein